MNIGQAINQIRQKRGIRQSELAKQIGITQASLSFIESGKKIPHKSTQLKICEALEVPIQFLQFIALDEDDVSLYGKKFYKLVGKQGKELIIEAIKPHDSKT